TPARALLFHSPEGSGRPEDFSFGDRRRRSLSALPISYENETRSERKHGGIRRDGLRCFCSQQGRKDGRVFGSSTVEPDAILASGSHDGGESRRRSSWGPSTSVPPSVPSVHPTSRNTPARPRARLH